MQKTASSPAAITPPAVVVGWLVIVFSIIPLAMGVHGDGPVYLVTGIGSVVLGGALIAIGRLRARR